ncbi:MAG: hypothetical protein GEV04_21160 [Actinophytocola sp.]|nr:hypothetical protein [Actinophytocola sp.]
MSEEATNPHAESVRTLASAMAKVAVPAALVTIAVAAVIATLVAGTAGLYGALVGGAVALASSLATIGLMRLSADFPVMLVMAVALGGYAFKLVILLVVMLLLRDVDALHNLSVGLTLLATVMVWAAAEVVGFRRTNLPTIVPN